MSYNLDRAEEVLQSTAPGGRESETWFLQALLREIDLDAPLGMSPAQLFQDCLRHGHSSERIWRTLEIVARPFERLDQTLRPGDMMLRAAPGTGDIGHVMVLVADDLRTPAALAVDGITTESTAPGHYGTVIEAGAFPHDRSVPYARRWLDGRGRVPPNSLILRPQNPPDDPYLDFPAGAPAQESEEEDVQPFELRHRAAEDEQVTEIVPMAISKDDSSPLPFNELATLDGAEEGAATEVDEPLARDAGTSTSGTTGAPGKPVGESRFWTNANRTHHVVFPGFFDAHFDFTPTDGIGDSGSVIGIRAAFKHRGSYKINRNTPDAFEMRVTIGTSGNPTEDIDATLVIDKKGAYVSGNLKGNAQGPVAPIAVSGAGTEKNPFRAAFPSQELVWYLP